MVLLLVWRLFERLLCNKIVPTVVTRVEPHKEAQLLLSFLYFRFIACWFILFILHPHQRHPKLLQVVWPYKEGVSYLNVCYKNHNFIIISKHLFCAYIMEILMLCGKRCPIIALVFFFCYVGCRLCYVEMHEVEGEGFNVRQVEWIYILIQLIYLDLIQVVFNVSRAFQS
jgi:hypothetical protein